MRTPTPDQYAQLGLQLRPADTHDFIRFGIDTDTALHDWWFVNGMSREGRVTRLAQGREHLGYLAVQTAMSLVVFMLACDEVMSTLASGPVPLDLDTLIADPMAFEAIPDRYYERAEEHPLFATLLSPDLSLDELIVLLDEELKWRAWVADAVGGYLDSFKATLPAALHGTDQMRPSACRKGMMLL